jgi:hypothetical protein
VRGERYHHIVSVQPRQPDILKWGSILQQSASMFRSIRLRIMAAALLFALAWALGLGLRGITDIFITICCLVIGSIALACLVWEYHRAWRLHPAGPGPSLLSDLKNWSGVSIQGLIIKPEYVSAALALLICSIAVYKYLQITSQPSLLMTPISAPSSLLPESRPLQ